MNHRPTAACLAALLATLVLASPGPDKHLTLKFSELLVPSGRSLKASAILTNANGKAVTLEGFMAQMEKPPTGGFWLCPTPVFQDESGAGTGDLPPNAVFIVVRGASEKPVAFLRGKLKVSGVLRLSEKAPRITLVLDSQEDSK